MIKKYVVYESELIQPDEVTVFLNYDLCIYFICVYVRYYT